MQRPFIVCQPEKCTGCQLCEFACSARHGGYNPQMSEIRLVRRQPAAIMAIACRLCDEPTCMYACPRVYQRQRDDRHHAGGQGRVQRLRLVRGSLRVRRGEHQPRRAYRLHVQSVRGPRRRSRAVWRSASTGRCPCRRRRLWPNVAARRSCSPACCRRCGPAPRSRR